MLRTRQTADALYRLTGVQATVEDGLKEVDYGEWEGLRQEDVKERWPEAFELRERIAQPVAAVTMFVVTNRTAQLTILGDRSHLSEELRNQAGT